MNKNVWLLNNKSKKDRGFYQSACALGQLASNDGTLDLWYDHQFSQNENTSENNGTEIRSAFMVEHTPIDPGTMVGTIYLGDTAIQTFIVQSSGRVKIDKIGNPAKFAEEMGVDLNTGQIFARFNLPPGRHRLVVSYEYNLECQPTDQ